MTGRERIEAALSPDGTARTPVVVPYNSIFLRDHLADISIQPWWAMQSADMTALAQVYADLIAAVPQDWFHLPGGPSHADRESIRIDPRDDGVWRVDARTGKSERLEPPMVGGRHIALGGRPDPPGTREDIDRLIPIQTADDIARTFREGRGDLAAELMAGPAADLFPMGSISSPVWGLIGLWPFEEFMIQLVENVELIEYAVARRTERLVQWAPHARLLGCRGVWIEDCWTDMLSPAQYRRYNLPGLRALTDALHAEGVLSVHYYCGNPNDRMDLLMDTGADALALEEGKKGFDIDIARIAGEVDGRIALLGNLDAYGVLERAGDAALEDEIARQLAAGRRNRGRFILSLGSPVTPGTPVSRVRDYCALARRLADA